MNHCVRPVASQCRFALQRQYGAALIVSLVILTALTLLGVSAMQQGTMQERMTGNMRDKSVALQAAEAALREAEHYLDNTAVPGPFNDSDGLYTPAPDGDLPRWQQVDWSRDAAVREYSISGVAENPRYIIEKVPGIPFGNRELAGDEPIPAGAIYRITARSTGMSGDAVAMVQSTFRVD